MQLSILGPVQVDGRVALTHLRLAEVGDDPREHLVRAVQSRARAAHPR